MGNRQSYQIEETPHLELDELINGIISDYITSQDFNNLKKITDPEYCGKLITITSKIFNNYLNSSQIKYLGVRKQLLGDRVPLLSTKVLPIPEGKAEKYDVENPEEKQNICNGLAKHYVQIANLFAAIACTINYNKDNYNNNNELDTGELKFDESEPLSASQNTISNLINSNLSNNLCTKKLNILLGKQNINDIDNDIKLGKIKINPKFCKSNCSENDTNCEKSMNLTEENGILELTSLYNDIYNFKTGKFDSMTPDMLKLYNSNLKQFYKSFTGSSYMPDSITQFEDIRLRDYFNQAGCKKGLFNEEISSNENNNHLFKKYISSIKLMIDTISSAHNKLVIIIKKLFVLTLYTKSFFIIITNLL